MEDWKWIRCRLTRLNVIKKMKQIELESYRKLFDWNNSILYFRDTSRSNEMILFSLTKLLTCSTDKDYWIGLCLFDHTQNNYYVILVDYTLRLKSPFFIALSCRHRSNTQSIYIDFYVYVFSLLFSLSNCTMLNRWRISRETRFNVHL